MSIQIIRKNQQARGQFNGGEILENKPIGFPREGGHLKPYSNLFYWSHAWSDHGSTIGLHPHQGFEIMSFVLEGSIEHFDTAHKEWRRLDKGDAQIIRSGSGIAHSEKLNAGAHMFQIWLDPNLSETLQKAASYNDYKAADFPFDDSGRIRSRTYVGEKAPIKMDAKIEIKLIELQKGEQLLKLNRDQLHSFYLVKGNVVVENQQLSKDDFFIVNETEGLTIIANEEASLFLLSSPEQLTYKTYAESMVL